MKDSKIEWCDHTFNPWEGCTKVSPGCANCYAENRNARFGGGTAVNWGKGAPRRRTSASNWNQPVKWNAAEETKMVGHAEFAAGRRPRVFCASLADWLDDEVPIEWLADLLDLIRRTPSLDWLLLTKRPENWRSRLKEVRDYALGYEDGLLHRYIHCWLDRADFAPPANIWIGTTVEDQARADERIPELLRIPARVRFLSCEPLLGPVDLGDAYPHDEVPGLIDWVICGGESGPKARPMHPDWARSLRDQCAEAGVPFLFKQWGEWIPFEENLPADATVTEFTVDGVNKKVHQAGPMAFANVGKRIAGRLLDGVEHNGFPGGAA